MVSFVCHSEHPPLVILTSSLCHSEHPPFVILNEVKNLCIWLTLCYDAILHFVQNDRVKGEE